MEAVKLCVVGDGMSGKTSLAMVLSTNQVPTETVPTVFDNFATTRVVDGRPVRVQIWDTSGQDDYDRLRPLAYPSTQVFVIVFSLAECV